MTDHAIDSICWTVAFVSLLAYWAWKERDPWWITKKGKKDGE